MRHLIFLSVLFMTCLAMASVVSMESDYTPGSKRIAYMKETYGFVNWPGKDDRVRDGFKVTPDMLPAALKLASISQARAGADPTTGALAVSRRYKINNMNGSEALTIDLTITQTCAQAQECIIDVFAMSSKPQPPLFPKGSKYGLYLGDVCFGGVGSVLWARNNIYVRVDANRKNMYPFVAPVARAIDQAILKRPPFETYFECKSRPVVTTSTRIYDPEERRRLALPDGWYWKVEAKDPHGEKLEYVDMNFARQTIPVVANESNLVAFPPQFTWVEEISKASSRFQILYFDWQEAKALGDNDEIERKYRELTDLGIAVLPALMEKIRAGESDLLSLATEMTAGEAEIVGTTAEERIRSSLHWWHENSSRWYRRIEHHYQRDAEKE